MVRFPSMLSVALLAIGCSKSEPVPVESSNQPPVHQNSPWIVPGRERPPTQTVDEAELPDDARVIGVVADGKARAYWQQPMFNPANHIINDLYGDVPITVTYCDRTDCVRVFTDETRGKPLKVGLMGYENGLLLRLDERGYHQENGRSMVSDSTETFPYADYPSEVTTWKAWKTAHPGTDVFTGK